MEMEAAQNEVWDRQSAIRNQVLMGLPVGIGAYAIARYRPKKLLYYLPGVVLFVTAWRRFICARCRYYGRECSCMLGIMTARMMPKDESKPLDRNAMIADFAFIGLLAAVPLPQVLKRKRLAFLYLLASALGLAFLLLDSCGRCENDFCPMKDIAEKIS